jgi:hypothetical protein
MTPLKWDEDEENPEMIKSETKMPCGPGNCHPILPGWTLLV